MYCNVYKESISAAHVLDIEIEEPPPVYGIDPKSSAEELYRPHAAMKEKLLIASNTEKLQLLTFVPDCWSWKYCSEYFGVSDNSICKRIEAKKGDTCTTFPEKRESNDPRKIDLVHAFYEDD